MTVVSFLRSTSTPCSRETKSSTLPSFLLRMIVASKSISFYVAPFFSFPDGIGFSHKECFALAAGFRTVVEHVAWIAFAFAFSGPKLAFCYQAISGLGRLATRFVRVVAFRVLRVRRSGPIAVYGRLRCVFAFAFAGIAREFAVLEHPVRIVLAFVVCRPSFASFVVVQAQRNRRFHGSVRCVRLVSIQTVVARSLAVSKHPDRIVGTFPRGCPSRAFVAAVHTRRAETTAAMVAGQFAVFEHPIGILGALVVCGPFRTFDVVVHATRDRSFSGCYGSRVRTIPRRRWALGGNRVGAALVTGLGAVGPHIGWVCFAFAFSGPEGAFCVQTNSAHGFGTGLVFVEALERSKCRGCRRRCRVAGTRCWRHGAVWSGEGCRVRGRG